ncbi:hypothetical protein BSLG_006634 [Batrachochytrium salamandrivorans]|nr:hypothetical protein BSLG_006634 [Batrachochytrium salamandrivorans]
MAALSDAAGAHKAAPMNRRQEGSRRIGTYMLSGWVLMDDMCPNRGCGLPIFRDKDRTKTICCMCDDPVSPLPPVRDVPAKDVGTHALATPSPLSQEIVDVASVNTPESIVLTKEEEKELMDTLEESYKVESYSERNHHHEQSEKASQLIGQKMLQGWTMMQDACPNCLEIPLVRNRQKQYMCVICGRTASSISGLKGLPIEQSTITPVPEECAVIESCPEVPKEHIISAEPRVDDKPKQCSKHHHDGKKRRYTKMTPYRSRFVYENDKMYSTHDGDFPQHDLLEQRMKDCTDVLVKKLSLLANQLEKPPIHAPSQSLPMRFQAAQEH